MGNMPPHSEDDDITLRMHIIELNYDIAMLRHEIRKTKQTVSFHIFAFAIVALLFVCALF